MRTPRKTEVRGLRRPILATLQIAGRTLSSTGRPIPAVPVALYFLQKVGSRNFSDDLLNLKIAETRSGRDGKYLLRLHDVPANRSYELRALSGDTSGTRKIAVRSKHEGATITVDIRLRTRLIRVMPVQPLITDREAIVRVFYVTDREQAIGAGMFRNVRARGGSLSFGEVEVSIPEKHLKATVERPRWWNLRGETFAAHFVSASRRMYTRDTFFTKVNAAIMSSPEPDMFVFVHGYNVAFDDAVFRTAQLTYDLNFRGVPILYSWPSRASVLGYLRDLNQADWSAPHFARFLGTLVSEFRGRTIFIVAHSMGSRVLAHAFRDMAHTSTSPKFREIVLAAPDIDAEVFEGLASAMISAAQRVTIYASSNDRALWLSKFFNGARRAGDSNNLTIVESTETIDASNVARGDWLHHSAYGDSAPVLDDMHYLILGLEADKRAGLRRVELQSKRYWKFVTTS